MKTYVCDISLQQTSLFTVRLENIRVSNRCRLYVYTVSGVSIIYTYCHQLCQTTNTCV